ncbi:unnamed protein product [Victoria cruziana]
MCAERQVFVEIIVLEGENVAQAISEEIGKSETRILVIGSSSRSIISRKFGRDDVFKRISVCIPNFCTVYVISKGRLLHIRPASLEKNKTLVEPRNDGFSTKAEWSSAGSSYEDLSCEDMASYSASFLDQYDPSFSSVNSIIANKKLCSVDVDRSGVSPLVSSEDFISPSSGHADLNWHIALSASERSFLTESESCIFDEASTSDGQTDVSSTAQLELNLELEKLRIELRHAQRLFSMAEEEVADASQKVTDLHIHKMHETDKFKEISTKEETATENALCERKKREAAEAEAKFAKQRAKHELLWRRAAEIVAANEVKKKHVLEKTLEKMDQTYKKFSWEEIVSASSSFSDSLQIGSGAYGTVYKCKFRHTTAAVKVLQLNEGYKTKQFQRELEILSRIRHPHLLLLLGACPDHGCLVYEFMENGSLEDRFRKNNSPPLCWSDRFRIAWEIASALLFLHSAKPNPVVHRDLKPANILLDHNFVSKIGDVGISTLLPTDHATTVFKNTAIAGTFCYIDPEYQRTGLVSPKSDIYALGMVILQLLTAKPPMALAHFVETALVGGKFQNVLDGSAGEWPLKETRELATLGLRCVELRRSDRPDLHDILPILERLKDFSKLAQDSTGDIKELSPSYFLCPILKEVMQDPCIAADGYTYERRAIERWLRENDKSPMSNLPFPNKTLLPNYTLLAEIVEWRSKNP